MMKRWPVIRHVRWIIWASRVAEHYNMWRGLGYFPVHAQHDYDRLDKIWRGKV